MAVADNRLPPTLRDKIAAEAVRDKLRDAINFLSFRDWLVGSEFEPGEWVVVARSSKGAGESFYTFSALAEASEGALARLLGSDEWEVMNDFGKPHYEAGGGRGLHYEPETRREVDGVIMHPFTRLRQFHGYIPNRFDIDQEFLLYHNAFFEPDSRSYKFVAEHGEIHTIVRESQADRTRIVEVAAHHLRDFLAAKKCFLVRYHDHTRWSREDLSARVAGHTSSWHRTDGSVFKLVLSSEHGLDDDHRSLGALRGKDVVYPYAVPDPRHTDWYTDREAAGFEKYMVRSKEGAIYEETCNPDELSNYFVDRGKPHCLTPVCFDRKVLQRYYAEPRRYTVSDHGLQCLDLWSMPFDINTAGLIEVWLYDLAKLPPNDQRHWKTFNVEPAGKTSDERFKRDFEAEWVDDNRDPVLNFQNALHGLQKATTARHGEPLIRELAAGDAHLLKLLARMMNMMTIMPSITTSSMGMKTISTRDSRTRTKRSRSPWLRLPRAA